MFRFIHAADPHLDSPLRGLEVHEGAPVELLRGATRRAFENLVSLAIQEKVDFLLIAGDLYDGDWKDYHTGLYFRGQMVRLEQYGIPVYLIAGNHDAASVITKKLSLPENVWVFSTRSAETLEVPGVSAVVHGRGFPHRAVPENLVVDYPKAISGKFNIGLLHTSLNGRPGHDTYAPCAVQDLEAKGYGYWALGHIHQPEVICREPWVVFAGNCQGRHVREAGARGCCVVTVNDGLEVEAVEWRALDVVRWEVVEVDLTGVEAERDAMRRVRDAFSGAVEKAAGRLLAARLVLSGATVLHGFLLKENARVRAEVASITQDFGEEMLWVERIKVNTAPMYDLSELAERDGLTRTVLEMLENEGQHVAELPAEIMEMLDVLPGEVKDELMEEWRGEARAALMADVRGIILEALRVKGDVVS